MLNAPARVTPSDPCAGTVHPDPPLVCVVKDRLPRSQSECGSSTSKPPLPSVMARVSDPTRTSAAPGLAIVATTAELPPGKSDAVGVPDGWKGMIASGKERSRTLDAAGAGLQSDCRASAR